MPQWTYKYSKKLVGDDFTLGHHVHLICGIGVWIGKLVGKPEQEDADRLHLPGILSMFQDVTVNLGVSMPLFFFLVGVAVGIPAVKASAGDQAWWMWLLLQGLQFAVGVTVLLYGVQQFLAAIAPAFKGWSQRIIPGAIPALDLPVFFPLSPMGALLGFVGSALAMIAVSLVLILIKSPVFIFPSLITGFFESGVAGVFANKYGGWKAALVTGLVSGLICSLGTFLLLPLFPQLAGTGTMFCDSDAGFILAPFFWICRGIASVLGVAVSL